MINRQAVLEAIKEFVTAHFPTMPVDRLETMRAGDVVQQSLELVELVLHLEEKLGIEVNINELGENLITENFGALADELVRSEGSRARGGKSEVIGDSRSVGGQ
jgi:acyl carrier protein